MRVRAGKTQRSKGGGEGEEWRREAIMSEGVARK